MARTINTSLDDSSIDLYEIVRRKLNYYWSIVDELVADDQYGNQLLIHYNMEKIAMLQAVLDHLIYN